MKPTSFSAALLLLLASPLASGRPLDQQRTSETVDADLSTLTPAPTTAVATAVRRDGSTSLYTPPSSVCNIGLACLIPFVPSTGTAGGAAGPTLGSGSTPTSGSGSIPTSGSGNTPSSGSGNTPTSGSGNTPSSGSGNTPTSGSGNNPSSGSGSTPTSGSGNTPTSGSGNTPTSGSGNTPTSGSGNTPTSGSGNTPTSGSGSTSPTSPSVVQPSGLNGRPCKRAGDCTTGNRPTPGNPRFNLKNPPSDSDVQIIKQKLDAYDPSKPETYDSFVNDIITDFMTVGPPPSMALYYTSGLTDTALKLHANNGMETVGTCFNGYNVMPFDSGKAPLNALSDAQKQKWFQATSRAYARVTKGNAFIISDAEDPTDGAKTRGYGGTYPAIFASDEFPELCSNPDVFTIWQIPTAAANDAIAQSMPVAPDAKGAKQLVCPGKQPLNISP